MKWKDIDPYQSAIRIPHWHLPKLFLSISNMMGYAETWAGQYDWEGNVTWLSENPKKAFDSKELATHITMFNAQMWQYWKRGNDE